MKHASFFDQGTKSKERRRENETMVSDFFFCFFISCFFFCVCPTTYVRSDTGLDWVGAWDLERVEWDGFYTSGIHFLFFVFYGIDGGV